MTDTYRHSDNPVAADLADRWVPSAAQIEAADEVLATQPPYPEGRGVYTAHLLVNKRWGVWTTDVKVVALPGVFTDREDAFTLAAETAAALAEALDVPVIGGYAWHSQPGHAAVWDLPPIGGDR